MKFIDENVDRKSLLAAFNEVKPLVSPLDSSIILNQSITPKEATDPALEQHLDTPFNLDGMSYSDQIKVTKMINLVADNAPQKGKPLLELAAKSGYSIAMEFAIGSNGGCSKKEKRIVLSPLEQFDTLVNVLTHECTHVFQYGNGAMDFENRENPREIDIKSEIMQSRAAEAGAQAAACEIAWEIFDNGEIGPYRAFNKCSKDIAEAYASASYAEGATEDGTAKTAAFLAWYDNNPIKFSYESSYQIAVMEEHKETNTDNLDTYSKKISGTETIATMCLDIDGKNFFKAEPSILEEGKYIDVADDTKQALIELFAHREAKHGLKPDASIDELPNRGPANTPNNQVVNQANLEQRRALADARISYYNNKENDAEPKEETHASKQETSDIISTELRQKFATAIIRKRISNRDVESLPKNLDAHQIALNKLRATRKISNF